MEPAATHPVNLARAVVGGVAGEGERGRRDERQEEERAPRTSREASGRVRARILT